MLPPSCLFHSVFSFILLFLTCSLSWISEYVLESGWIMQRCSLSRFLSLSVSVSFHLSSFCFLLSSLPERKERHRVIGFPLIARVMLTVHKSCHWNSTSFIFRFYLFFFCACFPHPHLPPASQSSVSSPSTLPSSASPLPSSSPGSHWVALIV